MDVLGLMDPELRAVVQDRPDIELRDIPAARAAHAARRQSLSSAQWPPDVVCEDHRVPRPGGGDSLRVRRYRPAGVDAALPCLYWNHGGGFVLGSVEQDDELLCEVVRSVGCCVISVDWRHAPEHPFPAAVCDSYDGLDWVWANALELRVDGDRIAIGGASSGGGLAAGVALLARDLGTVPLCHQLLIYPMLDDRTLTRSSQSIICRKVWNRVANTAAWNAYLGAGHETQDVSPYGAPARAPCQRGLPPAFIAVGALDVLLDEDVIYAQRLRAAEVPTELHVYPGAAHAFDVHAPDAALSRRLADDRKHALRRAFGF